MGRRRMNLWWLMMSLSPDLRSFICAADGDAVGDDDDANADADGVGDDSRRPTCIAFVVWRS